MYVNLQVRPELVLLAVARISAHATVDVLVECALHAIFRVRVRRVTHPDENMCVRAASRLDLHMDEHVHDVAKDGQGY